MYYFLKVPKMYWYNIYNISYLNFFKLYKINRVNTRNSVNKIFPFISTMLKNKIYSYILTEKIRECNITITEFRPW